MRGKCKAKVEFYVWFLFKKKCIAHLILNLILLDFFPYFLMYLAARGLVQEWSFADFF